MKPKDMKREHIRRRSAFLRRRAFLYGGGATVIGALAAWQLWPQGRPPVAPDAQVQTLPRDQLPVFAGRGEIAGLYRYAVEHGDALQYIPCFCGCGRFGHKSNRDCYIKSFNPEGTLTFTSHAAT
jgi:hypothetical protein